VTAVLMQRGSLARLAAGPVALALALGALAVAQGPGRFTTYAGHSGLAATLTAAAGLGLVVAGLVTSFSRPAGRIGDLAVLAGVVWFGPVWVGWDKGPPLVRSLGMLAAAFLFPLLLHLLLAYPSGRLHATAARALVTAAYVEAVLAALGLALFWDPFFDPNCWANCTDNVFLLHSLPRLARGIGVADRWFTVAAAAALVTVYAWRLLRNSGPARRALLPVTLPALLLAATVIAHAIALQRRPLEDPSDPAFSAIFVIGCVAVLLLAAGLGWTIVRTRVQRRAVARIATSLGQAPPPGSLQAALAKAVGDPELQIAYWLPAAQRHVDAAGRPVAEPAAGPGRAITALVRDGRQIALVTHTAALPDLERELGAAVRLALENERLQAEVLAQLDQLRASRVRIVETGDSERRRLERDLHDGAQQRLLALSYDLRLARAQAQADGDPQTRSLLSRATDQTQAALGELRELAHGIYPAILAEAGLAAALTTLADAAPLPVEIRDAAEGRYPVGVETAAYLVVAEALDDAADRGASHTTVSVVRHEGRLVVTVEDDGTRRTAAMVQLADQVGALDGTLAVEPTRLQAELPCA
ncbi:MAG TPA: histidine kinase, partial [Actinomycetota bacterium]|nr:histidine kinase [Actinomycetota bacterium]